MASSVPASITIRPATVEDIPGLADLLLASFHPPQGWWQWTYPFLRLGITEDLRLRLRSRDNNYRCLIALDVPQGVIVGTAELSLKHWFTRSRTCAYVANVAVDPHYRRRGIGKQLLQRCELLADQWQCGRLSLHVLEDNLAAQSLYSSAGFIYQKAEWSWRAWFWQKPQRLLWEKMLTKKNGIQALPFRATFKLNQEAAYLSRGDDER